MPWKYRKFMYLMFAAAIMWALSIIIMVRNTSLDTELLGAIGIIGGIAIVLTNLPSNGEPNEKPNEKPKE
jgi:hypothetical protein